MNVPQANCPSCGGAISFRPGTLMSVCPYCSSLVARADRDLRLMGQVAALVDTHSPLALGAEGTYQGSQFALVGRTQLRHPAGGVWDEWYLAFDDGRWGWLAEAQGHFYLTFERSLATQMTYGQLNPGTGIRIGEFEWRVQEVGQARTETAAGELPFALDLQRAYRYADLVGPRGAFATLDFGDETPVLYVGREIPLAELKLRGGSGYPDRPAISTTALSCPNCAAPLPLRLPDQAQRVTCNSCNSLLDASHGTLAYLSTLPSKNDRMLIPPGTDGTLLGKAWTSIGYMQRACVVEGTTYPWEEYLLYNPELGFRWLVQSTGHWSFVEPTTVAEVVSRGSVCQFDNTSFRKFQEVVATVVAVRGEFYWKVQVGEKVLSADFVAAPRMLSCELAEYVAGGDNGARSREVAWSVGTYLSGAEVWAGFKLPGRPPTAYGIAPNQPNPHAQVQARINQLMGIFLVIFGLLALGVTVTRQGGKLLEQQISSAKLAEMMQAQRTAAQQLNSENVDPETGIPFQVPPSTGGAREIVLFTQPFEVKDGRHGLSIEVTSTVNNAWLYIDGAVVSEQTGQIGYFSAETSYYSGVEDGETWSEGGQTASDYVSALPPGAYVARLDIQGSQPLPSITLEVYGGQTRWIYPLLALIVILGFPLFMTIRKSAFEGRRWSESMYGGSD